MVVCSRLAVLPEFRGGGAGRAAFEALYHHEARRGVLFSFHYCAPRLVPLFRRYGFREYLPPIEDAVISQAHRMVLLLDDLRHLQTTRSPFYSIATESLALSRTRSWFAARFQC
jgi:predicted acetyltransferase